MPTKKKNVKKKLKKPVVDKKFLLKLANDIYNPKDKTFLRLCDGTLQNGPDPTNPKRPMHCGLGELYFAMTGKQPEDTGVSEEDVVDLAVELSPLANARKEKLAEADRKIAELKSAVEDSGLPEALVREAVDALDAALSYPEDHVDEIMEGTSEAEFREILAAIPDANDDGCGNGETTDAYGNRKEKVCTVATFRNRSKRVANELRAAARLL